MYVMNWCTLVYFFIKLVTLFIHRKCFQIRVKQLFFHYVVTLSKIYLYKLHLGDSLKNVFISLIKLSFILCLNSHINKSTWLTYWDILILWKPYFMYIERYCRMLRYWFKLLCTDNCILKCLCEEMFESSVVKPNDKLNWACRVRDIKVAFGLF
jgi:hypothetical protein